MPKLVAIIIVLAAIVWVFFAFDIPYRKTDAVPEGAAAPRVSLVAPVAGSAVSSPLSLAGTAVGPWYFEASFPIQIIDASGKVLGQGHASAQGDWMTEGLVPWTAAVQFSAGTSTSGFIRLEKDNPSGDPARDEHVDIPVTFKK